ncbi:hypothetical protein PEC730217_33730 [Pectobacterium carotovorum subsp. carotovorum]|nr:hypothetical protein PEC730217_33730 [Pectobacterium carotovorum subsp. carotovorum]
MDTTPKFKEEVVRRWRVKISSGFTFIFIKHHLLYRQTLKRFNFPDTETGIHLLYIPNFSYPYH